MPSSKRIEFPCDKAAGREAARTLQHFLAEHGLNEELLFACELSLTEACNNAVEHYRPPANSPANASSRAIAAEVVVTPSDIVMTVTDQTHGFQWPGKLDVPGPDIIKGRGLFIIQSLVDEVEYRPAKAGNVLWMKKRRS